MKPAPVLGDHRNDIQAMLGSGFGWLTSSRFWLLKIKDMARAREWLGQLDESMLVMSVAGVGEKSDRKNDIKEVAAIAFSFAGLRALGLTECPESPFPTPFRSGMGSALREALLRDDPRNEWRWTDAVGSADASTQLVHILVAHWWQAPYSSQLPPPPRAAFEILEVDGCPRFFDAPEAAVVAKGASPGRVMREPFGFRDGISQPVMFGLKTSSVEETATAENTVAAGEFILGYRNEYDELSYCPDMLSPLGCSAAVFDQRFALNGSYLAVRQIEQDLDAFAKFESSVVSTPICPTHVSLAEKMMGRRRDGAPLRSPAARLLPTEVPDNTFGYRVDDENGFITPRGSHVRRVNPRDALGHDVQSGVQSSKLHRLLRRGRSYCEERPLQGTVGTFFIACNADIERQFEFVHQRWVRNPRFSDLEDEDDPLVGAAAAGGAHKTFSMPGLPCGQSISFSALTRTLGGGYFFLPGLKAFRAIVRGT